MGKTTRTDDECSVYGYAVAASKVDVHLKLRYSPWRKPREAMQQQGHTLE